MFLGFPCGSAGKESACIEGDLGSIGKIHWRRDRLPTPVFLGFYGGSDSKESSCNAGNLGSVPGLGRSAGGRLGNPFQYSCLENPHGQRSLAGSSILTRGESPWREERGGLQSMEFAKSQTQLSD